jgi:cobalt/nickel transport system permease protein
MVCENLAMHIPDAVLSPAVAATASVVGAGGLMVCLWKLRDQLADRTSVFMGTMAAFVFAAQMVNFPLFPLPISGHLLGGVLSAVLLGPWAGAVVIAVVLMIQCLVFGDGGVTALGANFINMGLVGAIGGYAIYSPVRRMIGGRSGVLIGGMLAAWFSVILASGTFALELGASIGFSDFLNVLSWISLVHAGIGLGEAVITGMVLRFLLLMRPEFVYEAQPEQISAVRHIGHVGLGGLGIALAVAVFLAPFASEYDDGLEWVGGKLGFLKEGEPVLPAPIPEYQLPLPGFQHVKVATGVAGVAGTLVVFGVGYGLARIFSRGAASNFDANSIKESELRADGDAAPITQPVEGNI